MALTPKECIERWKTTDGAARRARVIEWIAAGTKWWELLADFPGAQEIKHQTDLRGIDLSGLSLAGQRLEFATLDHAILDGATLESADLQGTSCRRTTFLGCQMTGASLTGAKCTGARFDGATLDGMDLSGADLSGATLKQASLRSANLRDANLGGVDAADADFRDAQMDHVRLQGADLARARFDGAELRELDPRDPVFALADMRGARVFTREAVAAQYLSDERSRGQRFLELSRPLSGWDARLTEALKALGEDPAALELSHALTQFLEVVEAVEAEPSHFVESLGVLEGCRDMLRALEGRLPTVEPFRAALIGVIDEAMTLEP